MGIHAIEGTVDHIMRTKYGITGSGGVPTLAAGAILDSPVLNTPDINDPDIDGGTIDGVEVSGDLVDSTTFIVDDSDPTKKLSFELSGVTAGQTSVVTVPDADLIMASTDTAQSVTGVKTFADGSLKLAGSSSGAITLKAPAAASTYVHTLPAATDTHVGLTASQNLTNKTITGGTLADPIVTGMEVKGGAAGAGGTTVTVRKRNTNLTDNVAANAFALSVPNGIHGAAVRVTVMGVLGDGDSTDSKVYMVGISRIAGAAAKAVVSSAAAVGATAGATADAVVTAEVTAMSGAVGATQTFHITVKVARSAGASDNHYTVAEAMLFNAFDSGVTIAAA